MFNIRTFMFIKNKENPKKCYAIVSKVFFGMLSILCFNGDGLMEIQGWTSILLIMICLALQNKNWETFYETREGFKKTNKNMWKFPPFSIWLDRAWTEMKWKNIIEMKFMKEKETWIFWWNLWVNFP